MGQKKGFVMLEATKKKISDALMGVPKDPDFGEKMKLARVDFKLTDEAKEKIRQSKLGKPRSEATKLKISRTMMGMKRGPQSEEHKQKNVASRKIFYDNKHKEK